MFKVTEHRLYVPLRVIMSPFEHQFVEKEHHTETLQPRKEHLGLFSSY